MKQDERNKTIIISTRITTKEFDQFEELSRNENKRPSEKIREMIKQLIKKMGVK